MKSLPVLFFLSCLHLLLPAEELRVEPDHADVHYSGRRESRSDGVRFAYSGARVRMAFRGASVGMWMEALQKDNWVNIYLNGERRDKILIGGESDYYELASGLDPKDVHHIEVVKATEGFLGSLVFKGFRLPEGGAVETHPELETRRIEFIGDSITCGYGIEADGPDTPFVPEEENFCDTYAWHAARALNADYLVVARSGIGMLRNYDGPREGNADNMPALYDRVFFREEEPKWDHRRFAPDVICVHLGTNDFSTSGVDEAAFEKTYLGFVRRLTRLQPRARIVLLMGPMQNKWELRSRLLRVVAQANKEIEGDRVSFFGMSPQGKHGFGAHWHPSQKQARINAEELTAYLRELMEW